MNTIPWTYSWMINCIKMFLLLQETIKILSTKHLTLKNVLIQLIRILQNTRTKIFSMMRSSSMPYYLTKKKYNQMILNLRRKCVKTGKKLDTAIMAKSVIICYIRYGKFFLISSIRIVRKKTCIFLKNKRSENTLSKIYNF